MVSNDRSRMGFPCVPPDTILEQYRSGGGPQMKSDQWFSGVLQSLALTHRSWYFRGEGHGELSHEGI